MLFFSKKHNTCVHPLELVGDFVSWSDAKADSSGYDTEIILAKTTDALLQVKRGEAIYERDSVLFDEIQYAWPLLAGIMWVAAQSDGKLNVLDIGGSLGSTYFQNRGFLDRLEKVRWNIVEQPRHVEVGRREFQDERLYFYESIESCLAETVPNVIILSSILQYLEDPYEFINRFSLTHCPYLIIDRTPFWEGPCNKLFVHNVPKEIYKASIPTWVFSIESFRCKLSSYWCIIAEFDGFDYFSAPIPVKFKGMIAIRQKIFFDEMKMM